MDKWENVYSFELAFSACLQLKMDLEQFKLLEIKLKNMK